MAILSIFSGLSIACSTTKVKREPITSLCIFDFEAQMCWIQKPDKGFSFEELKLKQKGCITGDEPCFYGLNGVDLATLFRALNSQGR
jgi:hypothetical protein